MMSLLNGVLKDDPWVLQQRFISFGETLLRLGRTEKSKESHC